MKTEAGILYLLPPKVKVQDTTTSVLVILVDDLRGMTPEFGTLIRRRHVRGLSIRDEEETSYTPGLAMPF